MLSYLNCFNTIKLALLKKNRYTYIEITRKNTIILEILSKYNVVYGYKIVSIRTTDIFLVYLNNNVHYFEIKNLHKISNPRFIKYQDIRMLPNKNTSTKYILSTSKGFLDIKDAAKEKLGGILVFRIY